VQRRRGKLLSGSGRSCDENGAKMRSDAADSSENLKHGRTSARHPDERGSEKYNLSLGDSRANALKEYLTEH
jgi:hypothetical protein